ncbi:MAG TPA: VOC family protein [Candidatus Angelobacter sp.]|nr:VOC family protein [Candidatus Angelobacter sp.]
MSSAVQLSGITAVMLGVRDLAQSVAFYKDKLGLKVIMQEPGLALLQAGAVMLGLNPGMGRGVPQLAGATEVVFQVDNVRAAHQALTAKGITFVSEPHAVTPTSWAAHFRDVDGHLLSVFGPEGTI